MAEKHVEFLREMKRTREMRVNQAAVDGLTLLGPVYHEVAALDAAIRALSPPAPAQVGAGFITLDGRSYPLDTVRTALLGLAADLTAALAPTPQEQANAE